MDFGWEAAQISIYKEIKEFAKKELNDSVLERDKDGSFDWNGWKKCAEMGILGLPVPESYGGAGEDFLTTTLAMEGLGYGCSDNGLVHSINSHLWGCEIPILKFGTEAQKKSYLPLLCKGEKVGAHALTESDAGSDVFSIRTSAVRDGDSYVINGSKSIVSNGPIADLIVVFAVTDPGKKFLGGISGFLVERGMKGLDIGKPFEKMGLNTSPIGEVFFNECRVPAENLLGREGGGAAIFQETMEWERSCLFSCHIGVMERLLEVCVKYAKSRLQFGKPIGKYQSVAHKLADLKMKIELGRLMLYKLGWLKMQGKNVLLETAISKLFISEGLKEAALDAVQIHGAYGYMKELGIEKELRDAIPSTIYSGTSEIQRNIIARHLGL
jgi:alkylation response protein AidB-like acyl-CoA dehydrogenase